MSTEKRLEELRAQRRLIENHLHWLEREIEREMSANRQGNDETLRIAAAPPASAAHPQAEPAFSAPGDARPADLPDVPEVDPKAVRSEVRRGCLIYLAAFALLGLLGAVLLYLF